MLNIGHKVDVLHYTLRKVRIVVQEQSLPRLPRSQQTVLQRHLPFISAIILIIIKTVRFPYSSTLRLLYLTSTRRHD